MVMVMVLQMGVDFEAAANANLKHTNPHDDYTLPAASVEPPRRCVRHRPRRCSSTPAGTLHPATHSGVSQNRLDKRGRNIDRHTASC
eukprot:2473897-Rhodomonas_salina.2